MLKKHFHLRLLSWKKIELLITEVELARHERDILSERLDDLQSNTIQTKKGQKYVDGVRQCCIN